MTRWYRAPPTAPVRHVIAPAQHPRLCRFLYPALLHYCELRQIKFMRDTETEREGHTHTHTHMRAHTHTYTHTQSEWKKSRQIDNSKWVDIFLLTFKILIMQPSLSSAPSSFSVSICFSLFCPFNLIANIC